MNVDAVIAAIVRQSATLVARLATTAGLRAPLADIGDRLFLDLVAELRSRGISGKVIADMFGLALRSYQAKVRRLADADGRDRTLWEAVLGHIRAEVKATRADILRRFRYDDEAIVRGVLNDLVESGLIYRTGRGDRTAYRIAEAGIEAAEPDPGDGLALLAIHRHGPLTAADLAAHLGLDPADAEAAARRLEAAGRVEPEPSADDIPRWRCDTMVIAPDAAGGVGAAIVDHVEAVVATLCARLDGTADGAGSTFRFEVWDDHPHAAAVDGALDDLRHRLGALREAVDAHNAAHPRPADAREVTVYLGRHRPPPRDG